jgi:hypothetical protein
MEAVKGYVYFFKSLKSLFINVLGNIISILSAQTFSLFIVFE